MYSLTGLLVMHYLQSFRISLTVFVSLLRAGHLTGGGVEKGGVAGQVLVVFKVCDAMQ